MSPRSILALRWISWEHYRVSRSLRTASVLNHPSRVVCIDRVELEVRVTRQMRDHSLSQLDGDGVHDHFHDFDPCVKTRDLGSSLDAFVDEAID